ncbi:MULTISPECIES: gliding motility protein GldL [Xanthomarina]|jgi:gliding motility-associated protein GldL|uniref:type IX secretion system motor protein PorL/GldL n=1 Tax=Xanthomarina TaxID=1868329 RepID=UPI000C5B1FA0|nr:gliding motility protein GldL [Xanthomarina sp.]MAL24102.1 gliding motility protein GldL [Xanthomarina sp.]MBF61427.1 gliding motility protein GldL [Xanthomarina sp.]MDX1316246.1 gliding motility protein GldL [Xanthomarina gelatinilytica]|tara:strand:+ start:1627 stop:2268 length:642 start_codon:yes stop_codon:yes gene_type:complete
MAQSRAFKKFMTMSYGFGASIVIIGALFKIIHFEIGPLTGNVMLTLGLVTEAIVFAISAFEPVDDDLDWSLVYPELAGGASTSKKEQPKDAEGLLSKKLDNLLKEAKIDAELMASLGDSIKNFEGAAKGISPTVDSIAATKKYGEELSLAAAQMESLNSLYKVQLDSVNRQAAINEEAVENATKLKEQMQSLASNLSSLNGVYGGMLSAMNRN